MICATSGSVTKLGMALESRAFIYLPSRQRTLPFITMVAQVRTVLVSENKERKPLIIPEEAHGYPGVDKRQPAGPFRGKVDDSGQQRLSVAPRFHF